MIYYPTFAPIYKYDRDRMIKDASDVEATAQGKSITLTVLEARSEKKMSNEHFELG